MNKLSNILKNNVFVIILSLILGLVTGMGIKYYFYNSQLVTFIVIAKYVINQLIRFLIPFIMFGIIISAMISFGKKGLKLKFIISIIAIAYLSSLLAGFFGLTMGYIVLPHINIYYGQNETSILPNFNFYIPFIDTRIAVVLAIILGLVLSWRKSQSADITAKYMEQISFFIIKKIIIPSIPIFIFLNFTILSLDNKLGLITRVLPIILVIAICHLLWVLLTYWTTAAITKNSSWGLLKAIKGSIISAFGSMSSTATMPMVISDLNKYNGEKNTTTGVSIPLLTTIHFSGSMISEILLAFMAYTLYTGAIPPINTMITFLLMLSFVAIGASGMPGGINMAAAGLLFEIVLGDLNMEIFAIMTAIYAIQDGFGTACNVACNSALASIVDVISRRENKKREPKLQSIPEFNSTFVSTTTNIESSH